MSLLAKGRLSAGAILGETRTSLPSSAVACAWQSVGFAERTFGAWETPWTILPATCGRLRG